MVTNVTQTLVWSTNINKTLWQELKKRALHIVQSMEHRHGTWLWWWSLNEDGKLHECCTKSDCDLLSEFSNRETRKGAVMEGGRDSGKGNESSIKASVPPAASIYLHWSCSRAELMPTCCTQIIGICIDACKGEEHSTSMFQSSDECWCSQTSLTNAPTDSRTFWHSRV